MALLRSRTGASHELKDSAVLGRHPDCDVVLDVGAVSRNHARITRTGNQWAIEDLHSRNGTYVNDCRIEGRQVLRGGDRIKICDLEFVFDDGRRPSSMWDPALLAAPDDVVADLAPGSEEAGGESYRIIKQGPLAFSAELRELRQALEESHLVFYAADASSRLAERLLMGHPEAAAIRPPHLRYLVVLDGLAGFAGGRFELSRFYTYVCRQLTGAFGLPSSDTYHEEDVIQILRSAPPSLLCLVNTSSIPHRERCSLRGLTQETHPTLIVYRGSQDADVEIDFEQTDGHLLASKPAFSATPEAKLRVMLEISWSFARAQDLNATLAGVLDGLFKIFAQADRGYIVLQEETNGPLVPKAIKSRRQSEDAVRISRSIVKRVLESREAVLSADVATDARFESFQSISDLRIRSMMCAPLIGSMGEPLGVLQIDTVDPRDRFVREDLEVLAAIASQAALAIENARLFEASLQQQKFENELRLARQVQQRMLPASSPCPPNYEFFQHFETASAVTGDFYDYVPLGDGGTGVVIGDIAGHGMASALIAAGLVRDVRNQAAVAGGAAELVTRINRNFDMEERFAMLALVALDSDRHTASIVNAGHMPPLCRRAATGEVFPVGRDQSGIPLGLAADFAYEECRLELAPGDALLLASDGVSESMNAAGQMYGLERMMAVVRETPGAAPEIGARLLADVREFTGRRALSDDWCIVCFSRQPEN